MTLRQRLGALAVLFAIVFSGGLVLAGALAIVGRFADRHDRIVIGSKAFTESIILAEIVSQRLEQDGIQVERRFNLGATNICFEAIHSGAIDVYPEYTGTGLMAILHLSPPEDRSAVLGVVRQEFASKYDLAWLEPLGFDNTYALAMPEALAKSLGVTKISDLLRHTDLRAGFASEFLAREDGWPGLEARYRLHFKKPPSSMEAGLMYQAAASGQLDVVSAYSTDGRIATQHLRVLDDDLGFFPPYQASLLVRSDALARNPKITKLLHSLAGAIGEEEMRQMNADVDFGKRSAADVAHAFLAKAALEALEVGDAEAEPVKPDAQP